MNKTLLAILSLALVFLVACGPAQDTAEHMDTDEPAEPMNAAEDTVTFGAIFPLTGDGAAYGEPISQQMMLAVDEINKAGGINGKMIAINLEDGKCNPKDGTTAANKLVNVDHVSVIFGGACSGETLGAASITEPAGVILISPSATSPDVTNAGDYVFRLAPSDAYAAKIAAERALEMGFKRAATIHETTDYAQGLQKVFAENFKAGGGKIVAAESFATEDSDFRTQILKIKNTNPDAIYVAPQTPAKGILAVKQIKEQGLDQQLFTAELLIGRDVAQENAEDFEGMIGVEADFDEDGELASAALGAYKAKYGEPPWAFYQSAMRDAVHLIADIVAEHSTDGDAIRDALYATDGWQGAIGPVTIDENGDPVLAFRTMKIVNGDVVRTE